MCSFKSIYFVIFVLNLSKTNAQISDKRLCVDQDCKEPISLAKTLLRYSSPGPGLLSFVPNELVTVFSKEADSLSNLWGVEINGKRGYVPSNLVREYKVFKKPTVSVDTELQRKSQVPIDMNMESVDPNVVQEPFDVIDGTTFYLNTQDGISPSTTESPMLSTAVPPAPGSNEVGDETEILKSGKSSKEKDSTASNAKEESVVDNVLSTISNWMKDDSTSEETEEAEDDEDDDDEEEDEDIEDIDESIYLPDTDEQSQKEYILQKPEDLNSLHNLPHGISVSPYSLQTEGKEDNAKIETGPQEPVIKDNTPSTEDTVKDTNIIGNTEEGKLENPIENISKDTSMSNTVEAKPENTTEKIEAILKVDSPPDKKVEIPVEKKETTVPETEIKIDTKISIQTQNTKPESSSAISSLHLSPPSVTGTKNSVYQKEQSEPASSTKVSEEPPTNVVKTQPEGTKEEDGKNEFNNNLVVEKVTQIPFAEEEPAPTLGEITPNPLPSVIDANNGVPASQSQAVEENRSQEVTTIIPAVYVEQPMDHIEKNLPDSGESSTPSNSTSEISASTQNQHGKDQQRDISLPPTLFSGLNLNQSKTSSEVENDKKVLSNETNFNSKDSKEDDVNAEPQENTEDGNFKNSIGDTFSDGDSAGYMEPEVEQKEEGVDLSEDGLLKENLQDVLDVTEVEGVETSNEQNEDTNGGLDVNFEDSKMVPGADGGDKDVSEEGGSKEEGFSILRLFSSILSLFGGGNDESELHSKEDAVRENVWAPENKESVIDHCDVNIEKCNTSKEKDFLDQKGLLKDIELSFASDIFIYLLTTSISVIVFLFGYMILDRSRREAPLVSRINKLEKELLVTLKENELLQEKGSASFVMPETDIVSDEAMEQLTQRLVEVQLANKALEIKVSELERELEDKEALEDQIESLEKELETSTEVGMELNRIISEMLDPTNGSDKLKENVEQLQRQLLEQKDTINTISMRLKEKEAENQMIQLEWEKSKTRTVELQGKLEEMADKMVQVEKEKEQQQGTLQNEIAIYHQKFSEAMGKVDTLNNEIQILRVQLTEVQRQADIKTKEYKTLQENLEKIKSLKNDRDALRSLLDVTSIKAELQQLRSDNEKYVEQLRHEESLKAIYEKKYQAVAEEVNLLHQKYEQADKEKMEANSRLEVLSNYFKKREAELQEEVIKYKSIWEAKEGEATSTTERIKYIQEEIENYKAQNETLKQEIISQEIDLKSQISMLEKKVHENWVTARQTERKLEDAKQEAAQLRNRLTLRERTQNRIQSPVDQNGELTLSPHPIDSPASPPLLYSGRDHITKSPPIPGLPPFLPPPPGAPFMPPPPHGMPPFMPPPPNMFPGDHRPPPLGRMSSPPLNSRYSPDTSAFSLYDRNSPSPPYDSEYGASPPPIRGYSPYNSRDDRRDYKRPPHVRTNGRNVKGSVISSGSEHSNDSLDKINRKQSKMV